MEILLLLVGLLTVAISYAIFWAYKVNKFFENLGVPYVKPLPFLGNSMDLILQKKTSGEIIVDISRKFPKAPLFGYFQFMQPTLIVRNQDLIEHVLVKDFNHFTDHGFYVDDEIAPLDANLFNMAGKKWKAMRNKLSPMFTSGKLKLMSNQMTDIGGKMIQKLESCELEELELKDIFERLTMDVIGSCGFGLNPGALENDKSEFKEIACELFEMNALNFAKMLILLNFPKLAKTLKISAINPPVIKYFSEIVKETIARRSKREGHRNDFIQLMLTLQEKGFIEITNKDFTDEYLKLDAAGTKDKEILELTTEKIVGQSLIFLLAGFETTTVTMLYLCHDLSNHQELQTKVRKEIKKAVESHDGKITYEAVKSMPYLEMCLKESMRIHPVAQAVPRSCTKEYTFPGTDVTIKPGQLLFVPTLVVHMDPDIYPNPDKYDPERFAPENDSRPNCSFLSFGDGPRTCIAMRFALTEMKIAMAHLLLHYRVKLSPNTKPLRTNTRSMVAEPRDTVYFTLERL